ncbi:hypothetical protein CO151_14580 [bacterium CG_4_9_14_3_um_filter_65_15]|nr:MAG: hypothetical protein CO151_14580 [bacterium CG_4_9_14_3_um_filter_65_15]
MKTRHILVLLALVASTVTFDAARAEHPKKTEHPATATPAADATDVVSVAGSAGNFKTLVAAIEAAGLAAELQGKGPFTLFAPTDEAFAKLPAGTVEDLLKPANRAMLAGILANHVVPGKIMSSDIKTMKASTVSGHDLNIVVQDGKVFVNDAQVVKADIGAANGVIHGIDKVIMTTAAPEHPSSDKPEDHPAH